MNYSKLTLYKNIQFPRDYSHVLQFDSASEQQTFFSGQTKFATYNDFLYIESSKKIVVNAVKGDLLGVNYLSFRNGDNNKYYYAFIDDMVYESDGSTSIMFTIDIMQTYMFDYELGECDVARAHIDRFSSNDFIETNEPILCEQSYDGELVEKTAWDKGVNFIIFCVTETSTLFDDERNYQGIPNLLTLAIPINLNNSTESFYSADVGSIGRRKFASWYDVLLSNELSQYIVFAYISNTLPISSLSVKGDVISGINTMPITRDVGGTDYITFDVMNLSAPDMANNYKPLIKTINFAKKDVYPISASNTNKSANFYSSKLNEVKCYANPFRFIEFSIRNSKMQLEPQKLSNNYSVKIFCHFTTPFSCGFYVTPYNKMDSTTSKRLTTVTIDDENIVPIEKDSYLNWVTTNGISASFKYIAGFLKPNKMSKASMFAKLREGANLIGEAIQSGVYPDQVDQVNNTSLFTTLQYGNDLILTKYTLHNIDMYYSYFHKYGYSINQPYTINKTSRYWFNYISNDSTNLINIKNMTHDTIDKIKQVYNNGVTLWHYNGGNYKWIDYDCNNIERRLAT